MSREDPEQKAVDQFILDAIDSVPHLEALLLLWRSWPKRWTLEEMAHALYVTPATAEKILQDLARRNLATTESVATDAYCYGPASDEKNQLLRLLDETYRRELIRISRMIHSKAAPAIREFARAFRFTKDKD